MKYKKGMVFGVFDGLHEGHKHFLRSALALCEELVVAVAPEQVVEKLKGYRPNESLEERIKGIAEFSPLLHVIPGDAVLGSWDVLKAETPEIVFLGYDQGPIKDELEQADIPFLLLDAHKPETYKTSILNKDIEDFGLPPDTR